MRTLDLELWAHGLIERVKKKEPTEDSREELKGVWPDPKDSKTARQLAGMANAALGEEILWLIGVHESSGVLGVVHQELASWWPQITRSFSDGVYPKLWRDLNVEIDGLTVVALAFETDRAPYVVRSEGDRLEIPWREGRRTRSATRHDLFRLLTPQRSLPEIEVLSASVFFGEHFVASRSVRVPHLECRLYVTPTSDAPVVMPNHRASAWVILQGKRVELCSLRLRDGGGPEPIGTKADADQAMAIGPGVVELLATSPVSAGYDLAEIGEMIECEVSITPCGCARPLKLTLPMKRSKRSTPSFDYSSPLASP